MGGLVRLESSGDSAKEKSIDELRRIVTIGVCEKFGKSEATWEPITNNESLTIWQVRWIGFVG